MSKQLFKLGIKFSAYTRGAVRKRPNPLIIVIFHGELYKLLQTIINYFYSYFSSIISDTNDNVLTFRAFKNYYSSSQLLKAPFLHLMVSLLGSFNIFSSNMCIFSNINFYYIFLILFQVGAKTVFKYIYSVS